MWKLAVICLVIAAICGAACVFSLFMANRRVSDAYWEQNAYAEAWLANVFGTFSITIAAGIGAWLFWPET